MNTNGDPHGPLSAIEVKMPEAGDRTGVSDLQSARLDPFEVTVITERDHRVANCGVDGTVGPLGHCVGHVERFKEQGLDFDRAAGVGVEVSELGVRTKAATGTVDGFRLGTQDTLRLDCAAMDLSRRRWPSCPRHGKTAP